MNIKKTLLFFLITFLMSLFLPNYVGAATTFSPHDTKGELLNFSNPKLLSGTDKKQGAKYQYTNIIQVDGIWVNAIVTIDAVVNVKNDTLTNFDNETPDPDGGYGRADKSKYTTSYGGLVSEAAIFSPWIQKANQALPGYVDFTISFVQGDTNTPVVLQNVYNNSLDIESVEYNAYGGFSSYTFSGDNKTNLLSHLVEGTENGVIRFSSSDCKGDSGLYIKDQSRVQAKFNTITSLKIRLGQFADGAVPDGKGGISKRADTGGACTNYYPSAGSVRAYGAIFVKDNFEGTGNPPVEVTAPTVNLLTTTNTKPSITGTIGGTVSVASPKGSSLVAGDTFSVLLNGVTYAAPNANLEITGVNWKLNVPTALTAGQTYEVVATRNGVLVDQTNNELVITPVCVPPKVLNETSTACITPTATDTLWCHSGDGISYSKSVIASTDYSHVTHEFDEEAVNGKCPDEIPVVCVAPQIRDAATNKCVTPAFVIPTVDLSQTATDYAVPVLTGAIFGTSTSLTITAKHSNGTVYSIGTATKTATGGWTVTGATKLPAGTYDVIAKGNTGLVDVTSDELTVLAGIAPIVDAKPNVIEGSPVALTGKPGSSLTITSVTLTKFENGLGAPVMDSPISVGSNIASGQTLWTTPTPSALVEAVGKYTITATDGNSKTGTNVLTVTCPVEKVATASSCVAVTNPTVTDKSTTDSVPVELGGDIGTSTTISSVTLTKTKDGSGAAVSGATPTSVAGTPLNIASGATTWSISSGAVSVGTYTITITDSYSKTATGTLTVNCVAGKVAASTTCNPPQPTVETQTTFDTTPVIKGTVGTVALETGEAFTVSVNGKTYTNGVDKNLVVTGTGWTLTILVDIQGSATPYPVVATRGTAPNESTGTANLTITPCALPKVVNAAKTACVDPVPTVVKQTINSNTAVSPVITGTVGEVVLGSTETFSVSIKTTTPQSYTYKTDTALAISGLNWTLTVPSNKAISAGTYDVDAARNTSAKDTTSGELVINLVCNIDETNVNGMCAPKAYSPTVETLITDDTTPVITGTVGTSVLAAGETFTVTVNGVLYPHPTVTGLEWSVQIPIENALNVGVYPVEATRGDLTGKGTVTITQCTSPKVVNATTGDCSEPSLIPTVTPSASHDIKEPSIVVAGTVGDIELTAQELSSNAFSVKVHNSEHSSVKGVLLISGINWTFTLTERFVGTFDVDAKRGSKTDLTDGELTITGGSCCISGVTTQCPTTISVPDYTGECSVPVCPTTNAAGDCTSPLPDPTKEETLPSQPTSKIEEAIKPPADLGYCDDGGKRSYGESMSGITIKRARIANAETIGGTFESNALVGMHVMYGTLTAGSYEDNDHSCEQGYCVNKTITGATLTGAFVDIANDYVNSAGTVIDSNNRGIALTGGVTNPTSFRKDGVTPINATITNGMITAGTDGAGNPVRGSITNGLFANSITHVSSVLTKGRRTQGTLTNATISGATITTVNGVSVVGCDRSLDSTHTPCTVGVIVNGTMDSTGVKTFGTVENATLTGATILNSNHCFSSGTVGSKGQLNWKEVVK